MSVSSKYYAGISYLRQLTVMLKKIPIHNFFLEKNKKQKKQRRLNVKTCFIYVISVKRLLVTSVVFYCRKTKNRLLDSTPHEMLSVHISYSINAPWDSLH